MKVKSPKIVDINETRNVKAQATVIYPKEVKQVWNVSRFTYRWRFAFKICCRQSSAPLDRIKKLFILPNPRVGTKVSSSRRLPLVYLYTWHTPTFKGDLTIRMTMHAFSTRAVSSRTAISLRQSSPFESFAANRCIFDLSTSIRQSLFTFFGRVTV